MNNSGEAATFFEINHAVENEIFIYVRTVPVIAISEGVFMSRYFETVKDFLQAPELIIEEEDSEEELAVVTDEPDPVVDFTFSDLRPGYVVDDDLKTRKVTAQRHNDFDGERLDEWSANGNLRRAG